MRGRLFVGLLLIIQIAGACRVTFGSEPVPVFSWATQGGGALPDAAEAVATDAVGNVYVAGSFGGTARFGNTSLTTALGTYDLFLAKYDSLGALLWVKRLLPNSLAGDGKFLAIDGAGNVVLAATAVATVVNQGLSQLFLAKVDPAGSVLWSQTKHGTGFMDTHAGGLALDAAGNLLVTGMFTGTADFGGTSLTSAGHGDVYLAKFTGGGVLSWVRQEGQANAPDDAAHGVLVDASGNIYVAAEFGGTINVGATKLTSASSTALLEADRLDVLLIKYDANGNRLWAKNAGSTGEDHVKALAQDGSGNLYMLATVSGPSTFGNQTAPVTIPNTPVLARFDANGSFLWTSIASGVGLNFGVNYAFTGAGALGVLAGGGTHLSKFSDAGSLLWQRTVGGKYLNSAAVYKGTNVYLCGSFDTAFALDGAALTPAGVGDAYVAKAILTTNAVPVLTSQPVGASVVPGAQVTFSVTATGVEPITYQWRRNGVNLPGGIASTYRVAPVVADSGGDYTVIVTNPAGSVTSAVAQLTVKFVPPVIGTQPQGASVNDGAGAILSVVASGTPPLNYQWRHETTNLPGATAASLSLNPVRYNSRGGYAVAVSNAGGAVTSQVATITVVLLQPSASITAGNPTVADGTVFSLFGLAGGSEPKTYRWQFNGTDIPGATSTALLFNPATLAMAGNYTFIASNPAGSASSAPSLLKVTPVAPSLSVAPSGGTVALGGTFTLKALGKGSPPLSYQWRHNGLLVPGANAATLVLTAIKPEDAGTYTVEITNPYGPASIGSAQITVDVPSAPSPAFEWARATGGIGDDEISSIALAPDGRPHVVGTFYGKFSLFGATVDSGAQYGLFVARLNTDGSALWAKPVTGYTVKFDACAVDAFTNTWIAGGYQSSLKFGGVTPRFSGNGYLAKYDAVGNLLWAELAGGSRAFGVAPASDGGAFLAGETAGIARFGSLSVTNHVKSAYIAKTDATGQFLWVRNADSFGASASPSTATAIVTDGQGGALVAGTFGLQMAWAGQNFTAPGYPGFLARFDGDGNLLWLRQTSGPGQPVLPRLAFNNNRVLWASYHLGWPIAFDTAAQYSANGFLLAAFQPDGASLWSAHAENPIVSYFPSLSTGLDPDGNGFLLTSIPGQTTFAGTVFSAGTRADLLLAQVDHSGTWAWEKQLTGNTNALARAVMAGPQGELYVGGGFNSTKLDFGAGTLTNSKPPSSDLLLAKIAPSSTQRPVLAVKLTPGALTLHWPAASGDFIVEHTTSLSEPFAPYTATQNTAAGIVTVMVAANAPTGFYRLRAR